MHVFVCGATGVLGRHLVKALSNAGHQVTGLTRTQDGAATIRELGGFPHIGDVLDRRTLIDGAADADAVVHVASQLPTNPPTTGREWRANDRVRLAAARHILHAARTHDISTVVFPSVIWAYQEPDRDRVTEDSPANPDRTTASAVEAESLITEAADEIGFDPLILRLGWLYGPTSGQTQQIAKQLLADEFVGVGRGVLGHKETQQSVIHAHDAARSVIAGLEHELSGVYHIVDDQPVTTAAVFHRLAEALNIERPGKVPGWLAKYFVGEDMVSFLTRPFPSSNTKFKQATNWDLKYPSIDSGFESVVADWLAEGWLVANSDGYQWCDDSHFQIQCRSCGRRSPAIYDSCRNCDSPNLIPVSV